MNEKIKLTSLGRMGWIPTGNRHTCCYCLEYQGRLIILDAGTGIARFDEPELRKIIDKYDSALLLLSHYHLDHITGLIYLPFFFKGKAFHIAGPGQSVYGRSAREILSDLVSPPFFSNPIMEFPMDMTISDLEPGINRIDGLNIHTVVQEHSDPSIGIKVGSEVCYITDTACSGQSVVFARNCKLLLHESWFDTRDYTAFMERAADDPTATNPLKYHSHVTGVAEIACDANVEQLMLIHLNPAYPPERLEKMEAHASKLFPRTIFPD